VSSPRRLAEIASHHAHVYFLPRQGKEARRLREDVMRRFAVRLGTWHERPVGPHPRAMFQIAFAPGLFGTIVPWLMLNHGSLSILVHANSGRPREDHVANGLWIGEPLPLDVEPLPETEAEAEAAGEVNTVPSIEP
jgi:aromatic ring-cleaving dioxygenase